MTMTEQEMEVMSQITWTVHGKGLCNCDQPSHLFLSNMSPQDAIPSCASCAVNEARTTMSVLFSELHWMDGKELLEKALLEQYDYRTLGMTEWCAVCYKPFLEDLSYHSAVLAYDASGNQHQVHKKCSMVSECSRPECDSKRVIHGWRYGTGSIPYREIPRRDLMPEHFTYANEERLCSSHFQEWLQAEGERNVFWCDGCSNVYNVHLYDSFRYYDNVYCGDCRDSNFYYCDDCSQYIHVDDEEDHSCQDFESRVIHSYGYKPVPCFFDSEKPEPIRYHLGFELEVEHVDEEDCENPAVEIQNILGNRAYLKYDGSLRNGFEIVTHPHTLTEYKTRFPWEFIERAKNEHLISWNSPRCGFHVHVSRYAFGTGMRKGESESDYYRRTIIVRQQHELKFLKLIYDNERQVQRLAGRKSDWARFSDKGNIWRKVKQGYQSDGHYSAVNVENSSTIEVRVFKGSLKRERLLANLEFVHSAVEYTRNLRVSGTNKALSWVAYSGYVYQNSDKYPHLLELMVNTSNKEQVYDNPTEDGE